MLIVMMFLRFTSIEMSNKVMNAANHRSAYKLLHFFSLFFLNS